MSDSSRTLAAGRYELSDRLGQGAQGEVWRARDTLLLVDRAVKILSATFSRQERFRAMLLDEARAMARMSHPHVLQVFDIGQEGEQDYLVTELAPHGTLSRVHDLDVVGKVTAMVQVLSALAAAHEAGIVHRDVKPSNLLRFADRHVKIADFGIALTALPSDDGSMQVRRLGSPSYCAPEQLDDADHVDGRADLYAAGATLYAMLTGANPRVLRTAAGSSPHWSKVPEPLRGPLQAATARSREHRPASAWDLAQLWMDAIDLSDVERAVLTAAFPTVGRVTAVPSLAPSDIPGANTYVGLELAATPVPAGRVLLVSAAETVLEEVAPGLPVGFALDHCTTAARAEALVEDDAPALVLLDLQLPDDDARGVIHRLRGRPENAGIPILVVTPALSPEIRSELYALGADEILQEGAVAATRDAIWRYLVHDRSASPGAERRAFRSALHLARRAHLTRGTDYCIAILVGHTRTDRPFADLLAPVRGLAQTHLGPSVAVHRWARDGLALCLPGFDLAGAELHVNLLLRLAHDELELDALDAGVVAPGRASPRDSLVQAEHLARLAVRAPGAQVAATTMEGPETYRIAIADDDPDMVSLVSAVLEPRGATVVPFDSGDALLAAADDLEASLVLLDIHMPGRDGFETLAALREHPRFVSTPIVMLTSVGAENQVLRGFELGADDWIGKPFSPSLLDARVRRLLLRRG